MANFRQRNESLIAWVSSGVDTKSDLLHSFGNYVSFLNCKLNSDSALKAASLYLVKRITFGLDATWSVSDA